MSAMPVNPSFEVGAQAHDGEFFRSVGWPPSFRDRCRNSVSPDAFVAENPAHEFVVAGIIAQDNRCRRMPELMAGDADADVFLDCSGDSDAEAVDGPHGLTHTRKKLVVVRRVGEMRAKLMDVAVNQFRQLRVERKFQRNSVFDFVRWNRKQIIPVKAGRPDQMLANSNADKVADADRRKGQ
jgi:hypothetical protein